MAIVPGIVDKTIEQLQFQVRRLSNYLQNDRFLTRRLIENIDVTTGSNSIRHALGYVPTGYLVIRKSANVTIYDSELTNLEVTLVSSGSATISIVIW